MSRCARAFAAGAALLVPVACGTVQSARWTRPPTSLAPQAAEAAWGRAREVFESRCVVCHGCYDAPCQLKLGTYEGIDRGASHTKVYDSARPFAVAPTRLDVDAHDAAGWRTKGFHPVLPEGTLTNPRASLLLKMLALKRAHPLPASADVAASFTLGLDRKETCADADHFDGYAQEHALWGMPYALPGLDAEQEASIVAWVQAGAPPPLPTPIAPRIAASIRAWEAFLDEPSPKARLASRYLYEHLFLASLYFEGLGDTTFFRLVRSRTRSGLVDEIATRRPFDDPHVDQVYYRFVLRTERPLEKTHMPYPLNEARLQRYRALFLDAAYTVDRLPGYDPQVGANPFRAFQAIPVESRYRFLLEEAEFSLMGFIKGPVCRGQVALDVIEDRFWVTFMSPDLPSMNEETAFLASVKQHLDMPAEGGSSAPLAQWLAYGLEHERYVAKKAAFLARTADRNGGISLRTIWDGDGKNANASLTVFRHFDSATVVKGLVGAPPKTAWVVGFPLLERIHYLLVAGFDVFGNVGHQLTTRLYMDFLRMEGEANFLMLLPPARARTLVDLWYRGLAGSAKERVVRDLTSFTEPSSVRYTTRAAENELFPMLEARTWQAHRDRFDADLAPLLLRLSRVQGIAASRLPELSFVSVSGVDFTITRDSAHSNVAHLFGEDARRLEGEDAITVLPGLLGAYPNALFEVARPDLESFVQAIEHLDEEGAYRALRTRFGVLRASDRFWRFTDDLQSRHVQAEPIAAGLLDLSRLEAY